MAALPPSFRPRLRLGALQCPGYTFRMPIFSLLFLSLIGLTFAAIVYAILKTYHWYWVAAVASWIASFLSGFSIGLYVFSVTVVVTVLALGYTCGVIRRGWQALLAAVGGLVLWAVLIVYVDDYWLFFPIGRLFDLLFSIF